MDERETNVNEVAVEPEGPGDQVGEGQRQSDELAELKDIEPEFRVQ